jgi:hypothetical protein
MQDDSGLVEDSKFHSYRSATKGLTLVARRAGMMHATNATSASHAGIQRPCQARNHESLSKSVVFRSPKKNEPGL